MKISFKNPILTIALFEFRENVRNKWLLVYGLSFLLLSGLITYLGSSDPLQASGSLLNLMLLLVPLFSLVFGSISFSESLSFSEILVAQPISRKEIFLGKWLGLGVGLSLSFLIGMGVGSFFQLNLVRDGIEAYLFLLLLGVLLTFTFLSISFHMVNVAKKRELIFGLVLINWFFFFVLYDLIIMGIALLFGDYPLEVPMLVLVFLNPIDLARVLLLMQIDLSALMGYSGAIFQKYLGHTDGMIVGSAFLLIWVFVPAWLGFKSFKRRDL